MERLSFKAYLAILEAYLPESNCPVVSASQVKTLETQFNGLFSQFGVQFDFSAHFNSRMSDDRNDPCITIAELQEIMDKVLSKKISDKKHVLSNFKGKEIVVRDIRSGINIPLAVKPTQSGAVKIVPITIMRKKDFYTRSKLIRV